MERRDKPVPHGRSPRVRILLARRTLSVLAWVFSLALTPSLANCPKDRIDRALRLTQTQPENDSTDSVRQMAGRVMRLLMRRPDLWIPQAHRLIRVLESPQLSNPNFFGRLLVDQMLETMVLEAAELPAARRGRDPEHYNAPTPDQIETLRALGTAIARVLPSFDPAGALALRIQETIREFERPGDTPHLFTQDRPQREASRDRLMHF